MNWKGETMTKTEILTVIKAANIGTTNAAKPVALAFFTAAAREK
jgi:hypothetical protein